ncbi:uncharacterized protein LOC143238262 [Tachypleus tridentatus]|uniref:uncharacterized protein LOC143238262 n=1 Tax=Tachypleus tridentatus TaxID=6853 RepID=UPI003FD5E274
MMRYGVTLCLLLCPILNVVLGLSEDSDAVIKERLEALDCTETTCYNIKTEGTYLMSWNQYAHSTCFRYGMTPAKPSDEETAKFLMDLANRSITNDNPVWLGLSQEDTVNSSAFSNIWRDFQPQTVKRGVVRMSNDDGFRWEIADPETNGWTLCEIPKANLTYCVNDTCYTLYPTRIQGENAVYKFCELAGEKIAVPNTPELAKQLATFLSMDYLYIRTGIYLNGTVLMDRDRNVIGNRDEWPFRKGRFSIYETCVMLKSGELYPGYCDIKFQYPLCESPVPDEPTENNDKESCKKHKGCRGKRKGRKGWLRRYRKGWWKKFVSYVQNLQTKYRS